MRPPSHTSLVTLILLACLTFSGQEVRAADSPEGGATTLQYPILFATQVPNASDFVTIGSTFGNHHGQPNSAPRGGDLWIRYPSGVPLLKNLTELAGYGETAVFQGADSIAVRDPSVHWDGTKAVFSMVIGSPEQIFQWGEYYWQLYEVTGLGQGDTPVITKVPKQPTDYNNVSPLYGTDGKIIFVSDRPRNGARHLYPQHDEYESARSVSGLWSLNPTATSSDGDLFLIGHAPSGSFDPIIDSSGRVIFTRWDHLQQDQQADADRASPTTVYGTFDYSDESASASRLPLAPEVFPEPRSSALAGPGVEGHTINHFFPWMVEENGTGEEVLNHLGRHEFHDYFNRSFSDDPNLTEFIDATSGRFNPNSIFNVFQIVEDPQNAGTYIGTDAPEFNTHASGQIVSMSAPEGQAADQITAVYLTHPDTGLVVGDGETPPATHSGHYRDPVALSNGNILASHTPETRGAENEGTRANPNPRYDFRLRFLADSGGYLEPVPGGELTSGIRETVSYWDPDVLVTYTDHELWEYHAVEVRPRPLPPTRVFPVPAPEQQIFDETSVDATAFKQWLADRDLALMVVRNATSRDKADRQQPFNLRVEGGGEQTTGAGGLIYDLAHLQYFQGDQIRGIGGIDDPADGRRVIAQVMHDPAVQNPPNPGGPPGSVPIASDGSTAATVPARRAMAWHTTSSDGTPVVRERYWITFQPGEIRVCDGCHGVNSLNQADEPPATNPPEALRAFLLNWAANQSIFIDGFETGDTSRW